MELKKWYEWQCPVKGHTNVRKTFQTVFFGAVGDYVVYVGIINGELVQIMEFWSRSECRDVKLTYADHRTVTYIAGVSTVIRHYPNGW